VQELELMNENHFKNFSPHGGYTTKKIIFPLPCKFVQELRLMHESHFKKFVTPKKK